MQNSMDNPHADQQNFIIKEIFTCYNYTLTVSALNNCLEIYNPFNYRRISYSNINFYDIERLQGGRWKLVIFSDRMYEFYNEQGQTWQNWFQVLQMFLKRTIESFSKEYQPLQMISTDNVVSNCKFRHRVYNQTVFVKLFNKNRINQDDYRLGWVNNQIRILKALSGQYTPKIYEFHDDSQQLIVVQEFIQGRTLSQCMKSNDCSFLAFRKRVMILLLKALQELKKFRIVHRNIHPNNIIITKTGQLKIVNFNYASVVREEDEYLNWLKYGYIAPQLNEFLGNADIYNAGAIFYQMIFKIPYYQRNSQSQVPKTTTNQLCLYRKMVQKNPCNRITLEQALMHNYFKEQNN